MRKTARSVAMLATAVLAAVCVGASNASATPADTTRVAVIGDSITTGYGVPAGQSWASLFEARQYGDNILPLGVNGATTRRWLQQYLPQLDQMRGWQPRIVVVALGANEWHMTRPAGEYADHLRQIIGYLRQLVPGARIVLLHYYQINAEFEPNGCDAVPGDPVGCIHAQPPDTWDTYGVAMRTVAQQSEVLFIDISHTRDWSRLQLPDQAHLTVDGHRAFEQDTRAALSTLP